MAEGIKDYVTAVLYLMLKIKNHYDGGGMSKIVWRDSWKTDFPHFQFSFRLKL